MLQLPRRIIPNPGQDADLMVDEDECGVFRCERFVGAWVEHDILLQKESKLWLLRGATPNILSPRRDDPASPLQFSEESIGNTACISKEGETWVAGLFLSGATRFHSSSRTGSAPLQRMRPTKLEPQHLPLSASSD